MQAAAAHVVSSHGHGGSCSRIHLTTSRWPRLAAAPQICSYQGQPCSRAQRIRAIVWTNSVESSRTSSRASRWTWTSARALDGLRRRRRPDPRGRGSGVRCEGESRWQVSPLRHGAPIFARHCWFTHTISAASDKYLFGFGTKEGQGVVGTRQPKVMWSSGVRCGTRCGWGMEVARMVE